MTPRLALPTTTLLLALVALLPSLAVADFFAYAQVEEEPERKFFPNEIYSAFEVSEPYVTFEKYNYMVVDVTSMNLDNVSDLDIEIMTKWAEYSNSLVAAYLSNNQTEIQRLLADSEMGQFSLMTNPPDVGDSDVWVGGSHIPTSNAGTACGVTYGDRSTWQGRATTTYPYTNYQNALSLIIQVIVDGYRQTLVPSSLYDYQKDNNVGMGGCNEGEFRDQRVIHKGKSTDSNADLRTGWFVRQHTNEPNPEVLFYEWPSMWWGSYVLKWHVIN